MSLSYKINKLYIIINRKLKAKKNRKAIASLNQEQLKVFNMVMSLAEKNSEDIRFDKDTQETMFYLPNMLVTITPYVVHIDNTHGFRTTIFPNNAFDIMEDKLNKEAHRVRRKWKYEAKLRINKFLNKVISTYDLEEPEIHG